jgi:hypothetical protein
VLWGEKGDLNSRRSDGERILSSDINVRTIFKPLQQVAESSNQRAWRDREREIEGLAGRKPLQLLDFKLG